MTETMDSSGIVQTLLAEYDSCETAVLSIAFQNHLYGCLSVIEQQTEEGSVLLDLSGTDLWPTIGIEYGFLSDPRATYRGSSAYISVMTDLLHRVIPQTELDLLEEALFDRMKETDAKYFQAALVSAELDPVLLTEIGALLEHPLDDSKIKAAKVDPIKKKRGLQYTRSAKAKTVSVTIPKGLAKTRRRKGAGL
jgi:hypothetical protein